MKLLSVSGEDTRRTCQPLRKAFVQKVGLPPRTAAAMLSRLLCVAGRAGRAGSREGVDVDEAAGWQRSASKSSRWSNEGAVAVCGL